jgi:undecaprenyl-diphosphatase
MKVWMIFFGNCRYHPSGFAPSWRERLDDGEIDVRIVEGDAPWSRLRLVMAVLTGRLGRSRVYTQRRAREVHVKSRSGPLRLARDGETFDGGDEFVVVKDGRTLPVYVAAE